jgi:hypothetical protein
MTFVLNPAHTSTAHGAAYRRITRLKRLHPRHSALFVDGYDLCAWQAAQLQREVEGLTAERIKQQAILLDLQHKLVQMRVKRDTKRKIE